MYELSDVAAAHPRIPLLYAHRGAPAELPENTMPSFLRALELGADVIETDAHLTADGHVVLSHDETGGRMAKTPFAIARARLDEVRGWDVGAGFVTRTGERPFVGRGYRMPRFDDVLAELPGARFNVDAKAHTPAMVSALLAVVRRHRAQDRVRLASFDARTLKAIRRRGYEGETGLAQSEVVRAALAPLAWLTTDALRVRGNAAQIPTHAGPVRLDTRAMIARFHAQGLRVDFWTIDDPREARRLLENGADGIMTDDPRRLVDLFAELRAPRKPGSRVFAEGA